MTNNARPNGEAVMFQSPVLCKPPIDFEEGDNPADNWKAWKESYEIYAIAAGVTERTPQQQKAIFLNALGKKGYDRYRHFVFDISQDGTLQTVEHVIAKFDEYYKPYKNLTYLAYKFNTTVQKQDQSIDDFIEEVRSLAIDCEFGTQHDRMLMDRLVVGIQDVGMRERLLRETKLTLEKTIQMCRAAAASKQQVKEMSEANVNAVANTKKKQIKNKKRLLGKGKSKSEKNENYTERLKNVCKKCATSHNYGECPAYGKSCHNCKGKNHYAKCCKHNRVSMVQGSNESEDDIPLNLRTLYVQAVRDDSAKWYRELEIGKTTVSFRIDSGADVSILPQHFLNTIKCNFELKKPKYRAFTCDKSPIEVTATVVLPCKYKAKMYDLEFYVTEKKLQPILSADASEQLEIIKLIGQVQTNVEGKTAEEIIAEFPDVFEGTGRLEGEVHLRLKEGAVPRVNAARKIPHSLHERVKTELQRMEQLGVIKKIDDPTEWVHPMVVVERPNGQVRICIDPGPLNEALQREHYPIPIAERMFEKLQGAKHFTLADAKDGFWHCKLSKPSSKLCTFATPWGRYSFLVMPFGLSVAPEIFQKKMDQIFEREPKMATYFDDLAIGGRDEVDHNKQLYRLLTIAREKNLKLNRKKLQLNKSMIKFLGHEISNEGLRPDEKKIKAITEMKRPETLQELQRFLGLVTYLTKFVPHMSDNTKILRLLLRKDTEWFWDANMEKAFNDMKKCVTEAPVLQLFDPSKDIVLTVDASPFGLGAVLVQEGKPVEYASSSLTKTQQNYAHIEKELLAIVFACERFHYQVYGRRIKVQTDHKPLLGLLKKPIESLTPRLQRLALRLLRYDCEIQYVPGKEQAASDALSRSPLPNFQEEKYDLKQVNTVPVKIQATDVKLDELRQATSNDPILQKLVKQLKNDWPDRKSAVISELRPYWSIKNELYVEDGFVCFEQRLVVPASKKKEMLTALHAGHKGIAAIKRKAKISLYWPGMNADIEQMCETCPTCQRHRNSNAHEPLLDRQLPERPWQQVAADFFKLNGYQHLLVIDYYSKYVEIQVLKKTTATEVITSLKSMFSRHGIPETLITDNGPPFDSREVATFCKNWGIQHLTSAPYHPQANGQVERAIGTIKKMMKKVADSKGDLYLALLDYRSTPAEDLPSPIEMLMGRKARTVVPARSQLLQPNYETKHHRTALKRRQIKQHIHSDKHTASLKPLVEGQPVWVQLDSEWKSGVVKQVGPHPRSYIVQLETGAEYRRNRYHIRPRKEGRTWPLRNEADDFNVPEDSCVQDENSATNQPVLPRRGQRPRQKPIRYGVELEHC